MLEEQGIQQMLHQKDRQRSPSRSKSSSSSSSSPSSSSSSLNHPDDSNREVGGKAKRSRNSRKVRSRLKLPNGIEQNNTKHNNNTKSVEFSNFDHTISIPHIRDFTSEEIKKCWIDEQDYRSIQSRSWALVEMMEDEKNYPISADYMIVNEHFVCVRGLVDKTSQCTHELDRAQRKLYKSVFRVQEELRKQGLVDPEALRKACKKYSKKSIKTARFVGISDEYIYNVGSNI